MLISGEVRRVDLGRPRGSEAGGTRPGVVVSAQYHLAHEPTIVHVVPLTTRLRTWTTEVRIEPDELNGLRDVSSAQCQHIRSVAIERLGSQLGQLGPDDLDEIRETVADVLELPLFRD